MTPAVPHAEQEGVDLERLMLWMNEQDLGEGPITAVARLAGGTQNILVRFTRGERSFVLRRPPARPRPGNNEVMMREARVLSALAATQVPHPRLYAACADDSVIGAAFYLMAPVEGFNAINGLPALHARDPDIRRDMGLALVDGAVALARVDHVAVGLADFGHPEAFLERQVARWRRQLEGYSSYEGWPGPAGLPGLNKVSAYLDRCLPQSFHPGILHGDYSMGNVMYRYDGPGLAAIIDWELATVGDPLLDLGWIIATWRGAGGPDLPVLIVEPWHGFPTAKCLLERYAEGTRRDLSSINWYVVLACYKLAIILEGTFARACAHAADAMTGRDLHETSRRLLERALHFIANPIVP